MKTLIVSLLLAGKLLAAPQVLELNYEAQGDYSLQIQEAFAKVLASDKALAQEFAKFESAPPEDERGRYSGEPIIHPIVISEEEEADFNDEGGTSTFKKTVALYYRFDEGFHGGQGTVSGFFAIFTLNGKLTFVSKGGDGDSQLMGATVNAEFQGFSHTLTTPNRNE